MEIDSVILRYTDDAPSTAVNISTLNLLQKLQY